MKLLSAVATATLTSLLVAACASEPETTFEGSEGEPPEAVAVATFALNGPACAQCAVDAAVNVCGPQAAACLQTQTCTNAGSCLQSCAPNDPMCIAQCVQAAAQPLVDLAECVVCQECPAECAGAWSCGGSGGGGAGGMMATGGNAPSAGGNAASGGAGGSSAPAGTCDNSGNCQSCVMCASQGPCAAKVQACLNDPACIGDPTQAKDAFTCAVCDECKNDCGGANSQFNGLVCN
jgi:hypothetical protein